MAVGASTQITDRAKTLGNEGDTVLGTCAPTAQMLLKHARVTGDARIVGGRV